MDNYIKFEHRKYLKFGRYSSFLNAFLGISLKDNQF